jgi:antitoxin HicB
MTSPVLPELLSEGDSLDEAYENVRDAFAAVLEI